MREELRSDAEMIWDLLDWMATPEEEATLLEAAARMIKAESFPQQNEKCE
jgi:hypothetical protein